MTNGEKNLIQRGKTLKISFSSKGDFSKTVKYLNKAKKASQTIDLDQYGKAGVSALSAATPYDTGTTASSWYYEIDRGSSETSIVFYNSNVNKGVNIAIILQYGHGTRNGGWVQGRDYINPAIQPVFDQLAEAAWKEVTSV